MYLVKPTLCVIESFIIIEINGIVKMIYIGLGKPVTVITKQESIIKKVENNIILVLSKLILEILLIIFLFMRIIKMINKTNKMDEIILGT